MNVRQHHRFGSARSPSELSRAAALLSVTLRIVGTLPLRLVLAVRAYGGAAVALLILRDGACAYFSLGPAFRGPRGR